MCSGLDYAPIKSDKTDEKKKNCLYIYFVKNDDLRICSLGSTLLRVEKIIRNNYYFLGKHPSVNYHIIHMLDYITLDRFNSPLIKLL